MRKGAKECEYKRKKTIKEVFTYLNILSKNKTVNLVQKIKNKNNNLLNTVENIDFLIDTIEKNYPIIPDNYIEIYSN